MLMLRQIGGCGAGTLLPCTQVSCKHWQPWSEAWPDPCHAQGYVVLNRPYAFQQWAHQYLATLEEDYVLMAEPDHIFLKPLPLWCGLSAACAPLQNTLPPGVWAQASQVRTSPAE